MHPTGCASPAFSFQGDIMALSPPELAHDPVLRTYNYLAVEDAPTPASAHCHCGWQCGNVAYPRPLTEVRAAVEEHCRSTPK